MSDHIERQCTSCGSMLHHAHDCPTEGKKRRETVEIVNDFSRTCCKCKKVVHGKALDFHFSERTQRYEASSAQMPKGWSQIYHAVYFSKTQEFPTTYSIPLCPDCVPAVLEFVGFKVTR